MNSCAMSGALNLVAGIGAMKLKKLNANHADQWLDGLENEPSTATPHKLH